MNGHSRWFWGVAGGVLLAVSAVAQETPVTPVPPEAEQIAAAIRAEEGVASVDAAWATVIREFTTNPRIQNGAVYERIDFGEPNNPYGNGAKLDDLRTLTITIPRDHTEVRRTDGRSITIFVEKQLSYAGHPGYYVNVESARRFMGVAIQARMSKMSFATYGEWDSHIEGGAGIRLIFEVPREVTVERSEHLNGEASIGHEVERNPYRPEILHPKHESLWWPGPVTCAPGWTSLMGEPDSLFTARDTGR